MIFYAYFIFQHEFFFYKVRKRMFTEIKKINFVVKFGLNKHEISILSKVIKNGRIQTKIRF